MFDRPHIVQPSSKQSEQSQQRLKLVFENDNKNEFLITNPVAVIKKFRADAFFNFSSAQQNELVEMLYQTLQKTSNNSAILIDSIQVAQHGHRQNMQTIKQLQQGILPDLTQQVGCIQDLLFQLILIGLNSNIPLLTKVISQLCLGTSNYEKFHLELIYQYVRVKNEPQTTQRGLEILTTLFDHQLSVRSQIKSYFYFNGFLSGILLNSKSIQPWHFTKGFAACIWFNISSIMVEGKMQDSNNLPVLFNCFSAGFGGFECYFNKAKLFYRILPPSPYQPPTIDSNGILIQDFQPEKWYYLAIEHDKPFLARAQLIAIVNDKQVVNFSMDYPKFEKQAKLNLVSTCNNFIGLMSSFVIFKEPLNNLQKFIQIQKQHTADFQSFDTQTIDSKLQDKLFLTYIPWRTHGKTVYDCIDMNDGELLINCGVWGASQIERGSNLNNQGGIYSILPLLSFCSTTEQVNQFLKVLLLAFGQGNDRLILSRSEQLFDILFSIIQIVPLQAVNCQTIQILAELRFMLQDKSLNESFFRNLVMSADFWISTKNLEVIQEFWSFVKVIYSQNPVQHNTIFPINRLVNLMIKICDLQQKFCCDYHRKTHEIFNGSDVENQSLTETKNTEIQIDKYLEPISGVLECVLTSGGNEILSEIEHLTQSLTLKSCPCFQMQVLKLIKVLLLDTNIKPAINHAKSDQDCASPVEFAQRFLSAKGLEILLHLCANNASLDVKAMCIKLIDVLSSHTNLIQMRIDTDLITYLSHVLLPPSLKKNSIANQLEKAAQFKGQRNDQSQVTTLNYKVMTVTDEVSYTPQKQLGLKFFSYQEAIAEETDQKDIQNEFMDDVNSQDGVEQLSKQSEQEAEALQIFSKTTVDAKTNDFDLLVKDNSSESYQEQEDDFRDKAEEEFKNIGPGIPIAPKGTTKYQTGGFKFGGLMLDGDSSEEDQSLDQQIEEPTLDEPNIKSKPKTQMLSFQKAKPRGLANLDLKDDDEVFQAPPSRQEHQKRFGDRILGDFDSDEEKKRTNDEEPPKPTQDVLMSRNLRGGANKGFNFALGGDDSSSNSEQEESKNLVSSPSITQNNRSKPKPPAFLSSKVDLSLPPTSRQKQSRGLKLSLEDDEQSQNQLGDQMNKVQSGGNTGATKDIEYDENQPILSLPQRRGPGKPLRSLALDTEKINELFNFGGEKGEMREEDALDKLEQDIKELANICVQAMRKKKDKPQLSEFETLLEENLDLNDEQKDDDFLLFNKPQTVKGIKKIDIEDRKKRPIVLAGISEEEDQNILQVDFKSQNEDTLQKQEKQVDQVSLSPLHDVHVDDFTLELENLYTSCLEWILNRVPQGLFKTLMIDDYDKITFLPAMQVLMKLVTHSNNMMRQRALQDMFMLAQWDSQNGQVILQHYVFHSWLLELLMPYQSERQSDSSKAVYDMGTKLHTLLLKNACTNPDEEDGFKKVNLLVRWPAIATEKGFDPTIAHELARYLLNNLIEALGQSPVVTTHCAIKNLSHITLQVHELVISSNEIQQKNLADYRPGNNESILQWMQRSFVSQIAGSDDQDIQKWREWNICTSVVQSWGSFFFGNKSKLQEQDGIVQEKSIKQLLKQKSQEDIRLIVSLLMQDSQSSHSPSAQQANKPNTSRLNILGGFKGSAEKTSKTNIPTTFNIHCLQAIVNLICLALTQSSTLTDKTLQKQWLSILELHFKYIITLSDVWITKSPDEQYFKKCQRRFAEVCSFVLAFLFQEIHTQPKSQPVTPSNDTRSGNASPHGDIQKTKLYQTCLKSCFIYLISLVSSEKQQNSDRACHIILTDILVKQYSTSSKPLINAADLKVQADKIDDNSPELLKNQKKQAKSQIRESLLEDFPQCFQQNDWKITFFHNSHINQIINAQINVEMIQSFKQKRQQYALRQEEQEASTMQANEEILKKIQVDVMNAVTETSQVIHETNQLILFDIDLTMRNNCCNLKEWLKVISMKPGMWFRQPEVIFKTLRSQLLGEGQHNIMKDRMTNSFSKIKDDSLQPSIFKKVQEDVTLIQQVPLPFQFFRNRLGKSQIEEIGQNAKLRLIQKTLEQLKPERKIIIECDQVSLLKALEKRTGTLVMTNFEVLFIYNLNSGESGQDSNIFFFNWKQDETKSLVKKVPLSDIKELQKRRFLGQNKALEIFLMSNHTLVLDFKNPEQRDKFAKKILRQRQNKCKNLNYYSSLDPKWIIKKSGLTEDWLNNKISNFQYLMNLNQLAGRSYHDLSQYPVFPWTLAFSQKSCNDHQKPDLNATCVRGGAAPEHFRDLTKNMQLLGSAERQAEFKRKFEDSEGFIGLDDRFHCGSHYSNPGIIINYFTRLHPLIEAHIVLQGMAMDHPDRIFYSLEQSYNHSLTEFSDVRELTPEFYCLPEILTNSNLIDFGNKSGGQKVDDVILPLWAHGDAVKFIQTMREAFESSYVSSNLSSWIDFVFGSKQRDTEAVNSLNTFSKITYQVDQPGDFDITTIKDEQMRLAYENQGYNFGITPIQLFKEKHPQKVSHAVPGKQNIVVDEHAKLKIFKPVPVKENQQKSQNILPLISSEAIMFAKFVDEQRIVGAKKENFIQNFVWIPKAHDQNPSIQFSLGSDKKSKFDGFETTDGMNQIDRSQKRFDFPMTILNQGTQVVKGGYFDGRIIFSPVEGSQAAFHQLNEHKTTVTALACDKTESTLITGTKSGEVIVWRNQNAQSMIEVTNVQNTWIKLRQMNDHSKQITSIFISEDMCLFATSSTDGSINIYNLWTAKHIRNFNQPLLLPIHSVVLAQSPVAIFAYFTKEDHTWNAITINGEQVFQDGSEQKNRYEEASYIVQPLIVRSTNHLEKLVYGTERGSICMRSLPSLERYKKLQVSKDFPVLTLIISPDRRFLLTGCGDGGLIVITERSDTQAQQIQVTGHSQSKSTKNTTQSSASTPSSQQSVLSTIQSFVTKQ